MTRGLRIVANPGTLLAVPVTPPPRAPLALEQVVDALEHLPPQRSAALGVMRALEDPRADATSVARAASADPALATRILRTANSAFFGLAGRVRDLPFAVTVLGFITVRSLAAAAAADVVEGAEQQEFWLTASRRAAGAALVAPRLGCRADDAFCAALLSELGFALIERIDPDGHPVVIAAADLEGECPTTGERLRYGMDHCSAASRVLSAWNFPADLCDAVAHAHYSHPTDPLTRAVQAGAGLAARIPGSDSHDPEDFSPSRLGVAHVLAGDVPDLLDLVEQRSAAIAEALSDND